MRVSLESSAANPPNLASAVACAGSQKRALQIRRRILLALVTLAFVVLLSAHAAVAGNDTISASGIGYLSLTLVFLACAVAFALRTRSAQGTLHTRWVLIAAGALSASLGYAPSFAQASLHAGPSRMLQTGFFNVSEALYMLAAVLFFAGVARSIVIVDMLQALLFVVLRFNLIYSPSTRDQFTLNHLFIGQLVALFLFLVAMVACLGAASRAELGFLRTVSCFFGLRLIGLFSANQVAYTWLHHANCSRWDLPGPILLSGFALYLLYTSHSANADTPETATQHFPSAAVRSLMPSFLAFVNMLLGLLVLPFSLPLAGLAIAVSLICYVARTVLVQAQAVKEKALLESRNQHLEGLAVSDPLTGIGNRRSLAGTYARLQTQAEASSLSLLVVDIDHFKQANDCHGHAYGDKVLVTLAMQLENLAAGVAECHAVRLGGDEFALLLLNIAPQQASLLAEELRVTFNDQAFGSDDTRISLSIGVASLASAGELPLETLICSADKALYRAKLLGRNRVEVQPMGGSAPADADLAAHARRLELQRTLS